MINPTKFYSYQAYLRQWVKYTFDDSGKRKEGGINNPSRFKEYIKDMVVRREYEEVMKVFPSVNRMKLAVQLDALSQNSYNEEVSNFVKWYNQALADNNYESEVNSMAILAKLNRMRHIAGLAKIPATISFAEEFFENTDKKLAIFVHHKDVGHIIYSELKKMFGDKIDIFSLTAELSDAERFEMQEAFNKSPRAFIVASTLASGEGINLQTCADAIMHERQWNPQNEDQAFPGRFRRIGQLSKHVNGTFVEAEGTVDEHLDSIVTRKRIQFHEVMNKGEVPVWNENDIIREIAETIIAKHKTRKEQSGNKETNLTSMTTF
jgi:SNF2 family DNA or RNA helicase